MDTEHYQRCASVWVKHRQGRQRKDRNNLLQGIGNTDEEALDALKKCYDKLVKIRTCVKAEKSVRIEDVKLSYNLGVRVIESHYPPRDAVYLEVDLPELVLAGSSVN